MDAGKEWVLGGGYPPRQILMDAAPLMMIQENTGVPKQNPGPMSVSKSPKEVLWQRRPAVGLTRHRKNETGSKPRGLLASYGLGVALRPPPSAP